MGDRECASPFALRPGFGRHKTLPLLLSWELETKRGDIRLRTLSANCPDPRSEVFLNLLKALGTLNKGKVLGFKNTEDRSHLSIGEVWLHG